jgi:hypothetical protein
MKNRKSKTIKKTATALVVTVEKFQKDSLTDYQTQGDCKPYTKCRTSSIPRRLVECLSGYKDIKKSIGDLKRVLKNWNISDVHSFVFIISNIIGAEATLERKQRAKNVDEISYYLNLPQYSFRLGLHNLKAKNYQGNRQKKSNYGVTFKEPNLPNTFEAKDGVNVVEYVYVYWTPELLRKVAQAILHLLETGQWDESIAPADAKNISPMKKNEKVGNLQGIKTGASRGKTKKTKYLCDTCQWYVGCTWCKDGKKSVCDGYKPYNTDYEYPSFDGICGAKKTATALAITVFKSSSFITLPQAFKRRSTTTKPRLVSYTVNGISARANLKQFVDTTKFLSLFENFNIDTAKDFIEAVGKCFPQQVKREKQHKDAKFDSKYQLLDFPEYGVKILFRISNHNINCNNITDDIEEAYSIVFKEKYKKNTFIPNDLTVTEYVYFTEKCDRNRYLKIAKQIKSFLETSEWDESIAPADAKNISPMKKNEKGLKGYDSINSVFNERLRQQIDGELEKGFIYELGMPSEVLISAGMENYPIEMAASRLVDKSMQENHPFELSEVFDLPKAIQNPLAVFRSATKVGAFVVLTELKHEGRNFVAAVQINQRKSDLNVNSIRSIHYRTLKNIIGWIEDGLGEYFCPDFCRLWLEPTKKELLSKPQYNSVDVRKQLSTVAKVVKDFLDTNNSEKKNISPMKKNEKVEGVGNVAMTLYIKKVGFVKMIRNSYIEGEKVTLNQVRELASKLKLDLSENELMQLCEVPLTIVARNIALEDLSIKDRFDALVDLYSRQLTIHPKDSISITLQQYSTPCPLAFLLGEYVKKNMPHNAKYYEPTAGNGLLTIALPWEYTIINELDDLRYYNLTNMYNWEWRACTHSDASVHNEILKLNVIDGIIANPPFAPLEKKDFLVRKGVVDGREATYEFDRLDHKIAIMALDHMKDDGRAAIIIGGKMAVKLKDYKESYWKNGVLFGGFRNFITYLNRQYNIEDILYINGDLYRKQGTTFPIVAILINGRTKWNGDKRHQWHPFDESKDGQIDTFNELYHRMSIHLFGEVSVPSALKAKALMLKMKMAKSRGLEGTATDSVAITFNKMLLLYSKGRLKKHEIFVCKAPDFWIDKGLECCDVMLPVSVIEKAMVKHELLLEHFVNFPDSLRKGNELFLSKSVKGAYVQLTELRDYKNNRVVVAIHLRRKDTGYVVYKIASVHGRVERQLDKWRGQNLNL